MKIDSMWEELENDKSFQTGLLYKRYSAEINPDIFISLKAPGNLRCIAFLIQSSHEFDADRWNQLRDIKLELMPAEGRSDKSFLLVLLMNKQHKDIFSVLCVDLISRVSEVTHETSLIEKLVEQLARWQSLFEKLGQQGLSESAQRGLFGEAYFLRKYLLNSIDHMQCIKTWTGPEKSIQDFQFTDWAVEVKTTHGKNHQKIYISNERQLDDTIIPNIFLYHLSLDIRAGHGETLNSLIGSLYDFLAEKAVETNLFSLKLMETGYFEIHKKLCDENGYTIRQENIYSVTGGFPRITEQQIPEGVGDVRYSIVLSESESWRINDANLFKRIGEK